MSALSVFLNTEKVIVTFVSVSSDRMSSETQGAINGHCAQGIPKPQLKLAPSLSGIANPAKSQMTKECQTPTN
jgi:hypothetical protein